MGTNADRRAVLPPGDGDDKIAFVGTGGLKTALLRDGFGQRDCAGGIAAGAVCAQQADKGIQ